MRVPLSLPNFRLRMMSDHAYTSFQDHSVSPPRTLSSNDPDLEMNGISQHRASISDHSDVASQANTSLNSAHALDTMNGNVSEVKPSILGSTFLEYFVTVGFIGLWYLFSVSISVYNKWMFGNAQLSFKFPLFTTSCHMLIQFALATIVLRLFPKFRPGYDPPEDAADVGSQSKTKKAQKTWSFWLARVVPCAVATGLDIGLGNMSMRYITLSFFTMVKSSTLGFVLAFAILFKLEKFSLKLAGVLVVMIVGVCMMVVGETAFNVIGFVLLLLASAFSGLRWSLTQILLLRHQATANPFATLFYLTPAMFVTLFLLALPVEGISNFLVGLNELAANKGTFWTVCLLIFPGCLAFLMTTAEFALLRRISVVTLSVCGIFKEVITISAGGIIFDEKLSALNTSGIVVTILAIVGYRYSRLDATQNSTTNDNQRRTSEERAPMLSDDTPDNHEHEHPQDRIPAADSGFRPGFTFPARTPLESDIDRGHAN